MEFMSDIVGGLSGRILQAADSAPRGERDLEATSQEVVGEAVEWLSPSGKYAE